MRRLDSIENLASNSQQGPPQDTFLGMPWGGMQVVQSTVQPPPQFQGSVSNVEQTLDQVDQMMVAAAPQVAQMVDTPMRPIAVVSFDDGV